MFVKVDRNVRLNRGSCDLHEMRWASCSVTWRFGKRRDSKQVEQNDLETG